MLTAIIGNTGYLDKSLSAGDERREFNSLVREMEPILQPSLGNTIALDLRLAPQLGAVLADRTLVEQVVVNLLLNAATPYRWGGG